MIWYCFDNETFYWTLMFVIKESNKLFFGNDFWEWHILQNRKSPNSLRFESRSYNKGNTHYLFCGRYESTSLIWRTTLIWNFKTWHSFMTWVNYMIQKYSKFVWLYGAMVIRHGQGALAKIPLLRRILGKYPTSVAANFSTFKREFTGFSGQFLEIFRGLLW